MAPRLKFIGAGEVTMSQRFRLPAVLVAGSLLLAGTTACATRTYDYRPYRADNSPQIERRAYDTGYRQGLDRGRDDARRGRVFSIERHDEYRDADSGYRRDEGISRDQYRQMYRDGFRAGYAESFQQLRR